MVEKVMHILIKFPSRGRPEKLRSTFLKYVQMAEDTSKISFIVSLDEDDTTRTRTQLIVLKLFHKDTQVFVGPSCGKIAAVNRDLDPLPNFDILLLASDDMIPEKGYDRIIREKMMKHYPDTDGVLFFNDGYRGPNLNTLCILGRKYYERFGYIYHPSYKSLWCDNEFTEVAYKLGKQTYFPEIIIRHEHPFWTKEDMDKVYVENQEWDSQDKQNYMNRSILGFPNI
jgi:hypothetical protein